MAEDRVGLVTLKNVRLSYPHLWKPQKDMKGDDGKIQKGKFGASLIIDPDTVDGKRNLRLLKEAKEAVMEAQWGSKKPSLPASKLPTRKYEPPADEEGNVDEAAVDPAYVGKYYVSARNPDRPQIVDNIKDPENPKKWRRIPEGDNRVYGGCYVNAIVRLWAQDNEYGKRVNAALELVQFYKHGESFGSGPIDPESYLDDELVEGGDIDDLEDYGSQSSGSGKPKSKAKGGDEDLL